MKEYKHQFKCSLFAIILFLTTSLVTYGQEHEITHGPYIQHLTTNSVVINWSTSLDCISWVEYYVEDGSNFYQQEREKVFNSTGGIKNVGRLQKVIINDLKPSTQYAYRIYSQRVGEDGSLGDVKATRVYKNKPLHFTTQELNKSQTSCIILSDMHENPSKVGTLLNSVTMDNTDFVLLNGDFINVFNNEKALYSVLDTCVDIFAKEKPLYIVRGNHETRGSKARELNRYFHFPEDRYYYTFSSGTTCFIVLDGGEDKPDSDIEYHGLADFDMYRSEEARWLNEVVESEEFKKAEQNIVFLHIPPFIEKRGNEWHGVNEIKEKFVPILNKAGIDLMLCGHTHSYAFIDKTIGENNFPIIISDSNSLIDLTSDSSGVRVKIINTEAKVTSDTFFEKK
jgi:predicted phosphodiesterase